MNEIEDESISALLPTTVTQVPAPLPILAIPETIPTDRAGADGLLQALVTEGSMHMLTLDQRRILVAELEANSDAEACRMTGVPRGRLSYWRRTNKVFSQAEQAIADGLLMEARARLGALMPQAANALEEGLEGTKSYDVTCPCGCEHEFSIQVSDQKLRVSIAKELFKRTGDMGVNRLKVDINETKRDLSFEDQIALAQLAKGTHLPPEVLNSLIGRGLVPNELIRQTPIEGTIVH